jgi:membrane protein implicated in regulation of membrane protease activity
MSWWGWIVVGAALLGGEMVVDTGFYLVFLGASALVVGLLQLAGLGGPIWLQWLIFGVLSVVCLVGFRRRLYSLLVVQKNAIESVVGEVALVQGAIAPGAHGRVELRGAGWSARNVGDDALEQGSRARVERVEGLVLEVRGEAEAEESR